MDFKAQLSDQLDFIDTSCGLYDAGKKHEAKRIALALRVICYNPGGRSRSTSLLQHLGATGISLLSTSDVMFVGQEVATNLTNLVVRSPEQVFECVPKLAAAKTSRLVPFADWWDKEIVYLFDGGVSLSRMKLATLAANHDGGAHVDAALDPTYEKVKAGAGLTVTFTLSGGQPTAVALDNCILAALRQMGYEVLNSLDLIALSK